jgi:hypothetical protein
MISDEALTLAVERGVITAEQALALREVAAEAAPAPPPPPPPAPPETQRMAIEAQNEHVDDEALRFVTGFADIFVSIGLALFFSSSAYLISANFGATAMWAGLVVLSWLVAEFFSRKRRQALPSILLLALFAGSVFMMTTQIIADLNPTAPLNWWHPTTEQGWILTHASSMVPAGLATVAATALHYWRFRVPITIAAMAAAFIASTIGLIFWLFPDFAERALSGLFLVSGLLVFLLAMIFDMSDLNRVTRRTDIAFWLHLLAAPLIVHPLISTIAEHGTQLDTNAALEILAIFLGFGVVSLIIDRRALLVSGLTYAGLAFGTLLQRSGFSDTPAATLLALGSFILILSALWHPLREAVLKLLPAALVDRLPHAHVLRS